MQAFTKNNFIPTIKAYLQTNLRIDGYLRIFVLYHSQQTNRFESLLSLIKKEVSPIIALKWLMLIQRCHSVGSKRKQQLILILNQIKTKEYCDFDRILNQKVIRPYKLYLQKALISNIEQLDDEVKLYSLINLLWMAVSFADFLFQMGRYYVQKYAFLIDFNITLGMDVAQLYKKLKGQVLISNIPVTDEIERLHEKLYIVFYNCYFSKYMKRLTPKWIQTQKILKSSNKSINSASTNHSNSKIVSKFQINFSAVIQGKQNFDDNIKIIRSMERILQQYD